MFNDEHSEKDRSLRHLWAIIAMLGHWLHDQMTSMAHAEDEGDRWIELRDLVECAFLTALHDVDAAGKLTRDSELVA